MKIYHIFFLLCLLMATTTQAATFEAPDSNTTDSCKTRIDYAVQIASVSDPNLFVQHKAYEKEVIHPVFETEKVCLAGGKVVYRILIPAEDWEEAGRIHSYYSTTRYYKDCFIVKYINGKRYN